MRCLQALVQSSYPRIEILLVDNGCDDGSIKAAREQFSNMTVVASGANLGYAGGCNTGLLQANGKYAVLLNNDAVVTSSWLEPLVATMESDESIAACQPKLLAWSDRKHFDYAGGAGGYLDYLGFPFCRGRVFMTLEQDHGQYDSPAEIFWASGACCLLRISVLQQIGLLDVDFFAHMEEIDLNWRMHLAGYRVVAVPTAVVFHQAGASLNAVSPIKTYLNHRNGLLILLKNYQASRLFWILPVRLMLNWMHLLLEILRLRWRHAFMIAKSHLSVLFHLPKIMKKRAHSRNCRRVLDHEVQSKFYSHSIVWEYFVKRRHRYSQLADHGR